MIMIKKIKNISVSIYKIRCPCGAMEAHLTSNQGVAGSIPATDSFIPG